MALRTLPVPSVIGGISQQPTAIMRPDKALDIENIVPLPEVGLMRRSGSRWLSSPYGTPAPEVYSLGIDLGGDEKYLAAISNENVRVFLSNGQEVTVRDVTRDADGKITGGGTPDFSYLNHRRDHLLNQNTLHKGNPEKFFPGVGWALNGGMAVTAAGGPASPLGWLASLKTGAEAYAKFTDGNGVGIGSGSALLGPGLNGYNEQRIRFSVYVNTDVSGFVNCDEVRLAVVFGVKQYRIKWTFSGAYDTLPVASQESTDASIFVTYEERLSANTFRLSILFDPARIAGAKPAAGDPYSSNILLGGLDGGVESGIYVWGALLEDNASTDPTPGDYAHPPSLLRSVQAVATTFVANPVVPTRADILNVSTSFGDVYGSATFPGVGGGSDETGPVSDAAYYFVKVGAKDSTYTWRLRVSDASLGVIDMTATVTRAAAAGDDDTDQIAAAIAISINGHLQNTDLGAGGNAAQLVLATSVGPVVQLLGKGTGGTIVTFALVEAQDSLGSAALIGFHDEVDSLARLPLTCQDDTRVRLTEQTERALESPPAKVVMRFRAGAAGFFTAGYWEEGVEYDTTIDGALQRLTVGVDGATLPHILVRRQDDSLGTVTGVGDLLYFEWDAHTWDDRLVGDDTTNPLPSFVTPPTKEGIADLFVPAIGFYKNRLVVAGSDQTVSFSEVSRFGNFARTTIQTLPSSDRIDSAISSIRGTKISDIATGGERLYILAGGSVLVVTSGDFLGPRSFGLDTVYVGAVSALPQGAQALTGFFFAIQGTDFDTVKFAVPSQESGLVVIEPSDEVPRLVKDPVTRLQWSGSISALFSLPGDGSEVYGLRLLAGTRGAAQIAWFRFTFGGGVVKSMSILGGDLFLFVDRGGVLEIERVPLGKDPRDGLNGWAVRLDRRVTEEDLTVTPTYDAGMDETTFTLPYTIEAGASMACVRRVPLGAGSLYGQALTINSTGSNTVVVAGDRTTTKVFLGQFFTSRYVPAVPVLRVRAEGGGVFQPVAARTVIKRGTASFSRSAYGRIDIGALDGNTYSDTFDNGSTFPIVLENRELRFGVLAEPGDVDVTFTNATHLPMNIAGLEWEIELIQRGAPIR